MFETAEPFREHKSNMQESMNKSVAAEIGEFPSNFENKQLEIEIVREIARKGVL